MRDITIKTTEAPFPSVQLLLGGSRSYEMKGD
jgi:hypothetical protein